MIINTDFIKILNIEVINDELSLDDLRGGLSSASIKPCCTGNTECNANVSCCDENSACNINSSCCKNNSACNINN